MFDCFPKYQITTFVYLETCFDNDVKAEKCVAGVCHLRIFDYFWTEGVWSYCVVDERSLSPRLRLTYVINLNYLTKFYGHELFCDYDKCNSPAAADKLKMISEEHHDITEMLDILRSADKSKEKEQTTSTTTMPALTSSSASTIRSSLPYSTTESTSLSISTTFCPITQPYTKPNDMGRTSTLENSGSYHASIKALVYAIHLLLAIHLHT
jgi:hypothetical protein